jgi:hypothetical protein
VSNTKAKTVVIAKRIAVSFLEMKIKIISSKVSEEKPKRHCIPGSPLF